MAIFVKEDIYTMLVTALVILAFSALQSWKNNYVWEGVQSHINFFQKFKGAQKPRILARATGIPEEKLG